MPEDAKANAQPIIIIKKKAGHHGHHGGAWKVAYADFVTAMMAFFMVMWLMNASQKVQDSVSGYFRDPIGYKKSVGSGVAGQGESLTLTKDDMPKLKDKLEQALREMPKFQDIKDQVKFTVTGEGLRIELLETDSGMFFESGNANPSQHGKDLLGKIASELGKLPNQILIEGHTDSKPFAGKIYTNWELSSDRANTARRLMQQIGVRPDQVVEVRGFADQHLFKPDDPTHPSNRRISLIVKYRTAEQAAAEPAEPATDASATHGASSHASPGGH
jgi:chemotaxis protein MotB